MRGFRTRASLEAALAKVELWSSRLPPETIALGVAAGRVLTADVMATTMVPPFDRAAMDGYAVRSEDTAGACAGRPALLRLSGCARPGVAFGGEVGPGSAVQVATGAPFPAGADAVVPVEDTETDGIIVRVHQSIRPGRHVGRRGEDIAAGTSVLAAGRVLRPQDLGILSALGYGAIEVVRAPKVVVVVTGDELLPSGTPAHGYQIPDMNSVMLSALIVRDGGVPRVVGPVPDDPGLLREVIREAAAGADTLLITGGSSTGPEDHAPNIVAGLGELSIHGVAIRPAGPTGIGRIGKVPVLLLPGNPVSCFCAYDLFAGRLVRQLGGRSPAWPYRSVDLTLAQELTSAPGRVDYARVRVVGGRVKPLAISGASRLSSTTRADGFVLIPADRAAYPAGTLVTAWLYDQETLPSVQGHHISNGRETFSNKFGSGSICTADPTGLRSK